VQKKVINIVFPCLLIANLLFSQVALNFLHSKDSEQHEATTLAHADGALVHQHSEHCKVCSLDTLFHFLENPSIDFAVPLPSGLRIASLKFDAKLVRVSFSQGRAPPASF
jgi:hypothetical protein